MKKDYDPFDRILEEGETDEQLNERAMSRREVDDFTWLMSDKRGRRFMYRLLAMTHFFQNSYTGRRNDTDFREGERNIGCKLIDEIHVHALDDFFKMLKEKQNDDRRQQQRNSADNDSDTSDDN